MKMRRTLGVSLAIFAISAAMPAKQAHSGDRSSEQSAKAVKPAEAEAPSTTRATGQQPADSQLAASRIEGGGSPPARGSAGFGPPDRYVAPLQVGGRPQIGSASWYGNYHLGRRTASGEPLYFPRVPVPPIRPSTSVASCSPRAAIEITLPLRSIKKIAGMPVIP